MGAGRRHQARPLQADPCGRQPVQPGSIDDKGSIATVLSTMKAVKESGLPLARTIRLMIETTEETGGDAMKYYRAKTMLPEYNIVLDGEYPAVVAEKGSGALRATFALGAAGQPGAPSWPWRVLHRPTRCPRQPPPACAAAMWTARRPPVERCQGRLCRQIHQPGWQVQHRRDA